MKLINRIGLTNVLIISGVFIGLFAFENFIPKIDFLTMTNIIIILVIFADSILMFEHSITLPNSEDE